MNSRGGDTIGGLIQLRSGRFGAVCTSSGGPWLKEPGRVGSSAIRGAGFDLGQFMSASEGEESEAEDGNQSLMTVLCLASGHGENLIETQLCAKSLRKLKKHGYIPDAGKFLAGSDHEWDLGLVTMLYDSQKRKGSINIVQMADGFLYGFVSSDMQKPALQYS